MSEARASDVRVRGGAVVYRLYDIAYEIRLDQALDLLSASAPERVRPVRGEAQAIHIPHTPITVILGAESLLVEGRMHTAEVSARIFDFGVVSLRLRIAAPGELTWEEFSAFGTAIDAATVTTPIFDQTLRLLAERIAPAIERPLTAPVTEDYVVYRITRLEREGAASPAAAVGELDVVPLLLHESRALSSAARAELLPHRFSYYADDLAILTWDNALVVDPDPVVDTDIQFVLEFANAQLLELRVYDALLDAELPRMYDRIAAARRGGPALFSRFASLLANLQALVADSTEIVERAENALKVTDDVYLARVYASALEIFRARAWRAGIDRKLAIIRETYAMLSAESQAARSEALEWAIVLLIVAEIVLALVRG